MAEFAVPCPTPDCTTVRIVHRPANAREVAEKLCKECYYRQMVSAPPDEAAVERLLSGSPVRATRQDRQAAVALLTARRESAARIAERLRISHRTATRLRSRQRQEAS